MRDGCPHAGGSRSGRSAAGDAGHSVHLLGPERRLGSVGFLNALSAGLALVGGGLILVRVTLADGEEMRPIPFLLGGLVYAVFIAVVMYHVLGLDVSAAAGH